MAAVTKIVSINQLVEQFKLFSEAHLQLNDFGYGPTSDISTSRQMQFPWLWMTHRAAHTIEVTNRTVIPVMDVTFIIMDQINIQTNYEDINGLDSDNQQEVISDTYQIALDLIGYIQRELGKAGIMLQENPTIEWSLDQTTDKTSGWVLDVQMKLQHVNCDFPSNL